MKKRVVSAFIVVLLVFSSIGAAFAVVPPPGPKPATASAPAALPAGGNGMVKVFDDLYLPENTLSGYLKADKKCSGSLADSCWKVEKNELFLKGEVDPWKPQVKSYNPQLNAFLYAFTKEEGYGDNEEGLIHHSGDGRLYIAPDGKIYLWDGEQYAETTLQTSGEDLAGKPQLQGTTPIIPLEDGTVQVGAAKLDQKFFEKYGGLIDYAKPATKKDSPIPLKDGGSLVIDEGSGASFINKKLKEDIFESTVVLPDGTEVVVDGQVNSAKDLKGKKATLEGEEVTVSVEGDAVVFKGEDFTLATQKVGKKVITTKKEGSEEERIIVDKETNGKVTIKKVGDAYVSVEGKNIFDEKALSYNAEISDGKIEYYAYEDPEKPNIALAVSFPGDGEGTGKLIYLSEDGKYVGETWIDKNGDKLVQADELKGVTYDENSAEGNHKTALERKQAEVAASPLNYVQAVSQSIKSYPAITQSLSSLLGLEFFKEKPSEWIDISDQAFASAIGAQWFPSAICEAKHDITPEGVAFVQTPYGSYQAVASIQSEKMPVKTPIACNVEGKCPQGTECKNDFCYKPEEKAPAEAYFYKVTWGVTAPSDVKLTPNIDEEGNAVSFNIRVGKNWIYRRDGETAGVIKLKPGQHKEGAHIFYSFNSNIDKACIIWDEPPLTQGGFLEGLEEIENVCFDIDTSKAGKLEWDASGKPGTRESASGGEVVMYDGFLE